MIHVKLYSLIALLVLAWAGLVSLASELHLTAVPAIFGSTAIVTLLGYGASRDTP